MKPFVKLFLFLTAAAFSSCGDDENKPAVSLEGKWKVTSLEYYDCSGATANLLRECGTFTFCATWEFASDGMNTIYYEGGGTSVSTYTVYSGNTIGFCTTSCNNMAYVIDGNQLTLSTIAPASNDCMHRYTFVKI
jgi:hypothetical protein